MRVEEIFKGNCQGLGEPGILRLLLLFKSMV